MKGPLILHIETATDICSVALSEGDRLLSLVESGPERSHATLLNRFIRKAMADAGRELSSINGVAISKGPGSYTGLRIGVSTAKGITYALEIPLLASGTLENMAHGASAHPEIQALIAKYGDNLLLCPMLDARRMEVYAAFFSLKMDPVKDVSADIIAQDSYSELLQSHHICFFGNGSDKCAQILNHPHAHFVKGVHPSAKDMIVPVLKMYKQNQFENVAYFEPFYLKDFIATIPKRKVL